MPRFQKRYKSKYYSPGKRRPVSRTQLSAARRSQIRKRPFRRMGTIPKMKKYGTAQLSEIYTLGDTLGFIRQFAVGSAYFVQQFKLAPWIYNVLARKVRRSGAGYSVRWVKITFINHSQSKLLYAQLSKENDAENFAKSIAENGLKGQSIEKREMLYMYPKKMFKRYHTAVHQLEPLTAKEFEVTSMDTTKLKLTATGNLDGLETLERPDAQGIQRVVGPWTDLGKPAWKDNLYLIYPQAGSTVATDGRVIDRNDIKITLGFNRITE